MSDPARCDECKAILEEIRSAQRESRLSPKRSEELRAYFDSAQTMLAGTGEGVDELLAKFPFRSQPLEPLRTPEDRYPQLHNPTMFDAIHKMLDHEARTGHKLTNLLFRK